MSGLDGMASASMNTKVELSEDDALVMPGERTPIGIVERSNKWSCCLRVPCWIQSEAPDRRTDAHPVPLTSVTFQGSSTVSTFRPLPQLDPGKRRPVLLYIIIQATGTGH